uniref:Ovule protein n=1 Tax=Meloidogyne incognita TaxID=6306 RepID=A0A914NE20_MELIC
PSQQLNNPSSKFQNDSISSASASFFFTKSPLGCLKQNARNCIPEPAPEDSFFTPVISKSLNWEAQRITSTLKTTSPTSPPIFQTSPPTKPTSVYSTKSFSSLSTSTVTSTTTTRKRPHSWTRPKPKLEHFTFGKLEYFI